MASAEQLRIAHSVEARVMGVDERVQGVGDEVVKKVENVNDKLQGVGDKVQRIDEGVKDVGDKVEGVDHKLDDTNRSSSPITHTPIPHSERSLLSQGTCSVTIFYDGFRLPIHPSIITSHPKLITKVQLSGSFKAVFSTNGSPLVHFCGYMENVCSSLFPLRDINPNHLDSIAGSGKSILWFVPPLPVQPYHAYTVYSAPRSYKIL